MKLTRRTFLAVTGAAVTAACDGADSASDAASDAALTDDVAADAPAFEDRPDDVATAPDAPLDDVATAPDAPLDAAVPDDVRDPLDAPAADLPTIDDAGGDATLMIPELRAEFPLGLMAGDMDARSAVLWTRFVGTTSLAVRVERMDRGRPVELALERAVTPGPAGFTHVTADGLRAGERYRAVFLARDGDRVLGRSSPTRFRVALADDALEAVTLGATSCTNALYRPFAPLQRVGDHGEVDAFVHLGDMAYCDGSRSADDFRAKYAQNYASEGFRRVFGAAGVYSTWDDHEIDNNWNPERINASVLAAAKAAFFEHRALRRDPAEPDRIWRSARWGATLELFILDCRSERRPSTRSSSAAQYLSRAQMDWLKSELSRSTARFKVIANSVPIANLPFTFGAGEDRWEGYAAARNEVLDHITSRAIRGVWWLSGDIHLGAVAKLETSGPRSAMRDLIVGPGGQLPNPLFLSLLPPQFDFTTGENNYATLRADPATNQLTVRFINGAGRVIFERSYANP